MMKNPAANMMSGKLLASVRLGRSAENDLDRSQWMADLYTFGAVLSRIDQATDRRDSPTITRTPTRLRVARLHYVPV